jgi:hypothetical protein
MRRELNSNPERTRLFGRSHSNPEGTSDSSPLAIPVFPTRSGGPFREQL